MRFLKNGDKFNCNLIVKKGIIVEKFSKDMYIDKKKSYQKYLKFNCKRKEYLLFSKINIKFTTLLFYFYKSIFEIQL